MSVKKKKGINALQKKRKQETGRMLWFYIGFSFLFVLLLVKLFSIQVLDVDGYRQQGNNQWTANLAVPARRGRILDRNMNPLAQTAASKTVVIRPQEIKSKDAGGVVGVTAHQVAAQLAPILDMDEDYVFEQAMRTDMLEIWLKRQVSYEQEQKIIAADLPGVDFVDDSKRYYIHTHFLSQTLGYTSIDGVGQEGLEARYNTELAGIDGRSVSIKSPNGDDLPFSETQFTPPTDGSDIVLTIDYVIQNFTDQILEEAMKEYDADKIEAIVMEPDTGKILAMAKKPDMDNNNLPRNDAETLMELSRNTLITDVFEPGSTFKVITTASALDMGITTLDEEFECQGSITIDSSTINCWSEEPHGVQDLQTALKNSCNPVFVSLGLRMGTDRFYPYIYNFGFGEKTGIDLYGESVGIVTNEKYIQNTDLARISFGQSIAVTPIQMINAVAAAINGGNLMQPYLVREVIGPTGEIQMENHPTVIRRVISEDTSRLMRDCLYYAVEEGVPSARINGVTVGGKTGTAQKYDETGKIMEDSHIASFVGFLPAEKPQMIVLVVVDGAKTENDSGTAVAAPIAQRIMKEAYNYILTSPLTNEEKENTLVPDIMGKSIEEASAIIQRAGLELEIDGDMQYIRSQVPSAGTTVIPGSKVTGYTGAEKDDNNYIIMPYLIGMKEKEAKRVAQEKGLILVCTGSGRVGKQSVAPGEQVPTGTTVIIELN